MTDLRTAAQQALEALEDLADCGAEAWSEQRPCVQIGREAITALRVALAEPCPCDDRPAAQCPGEWEPGCDLGNNPKYAKRVEMTPKELAASIKRGEKWKVAEPVQEPVYWEVRCTAHPKWMRVDEQQFDEYVANGWEGQRLYTAPPQRKPLTEEEISNIWDGHVVPVFGKNGINPIVFARAIEAKHGIGGQQ